MNRGFYGVLKSRFGNRPDMAAKLAPLSAFLRTAGAVIRDIGGVSDSVNGMVDHAKVIINAIKEVMDIVKGWWNQWINQRWVLILFLWCLLWILFCTITLANTFNRREFQ